MHVVLSRKLLLAGVAPLAAATLLMTACSSSHTAASADRSSVGAPAGGSGSSVALKTQSGPLGTFLTDGSGRAVYLFGSDGGSKSSCFGACATAWPPLTVQGSVSTSGGASASEVGTIARSDGTEQVTYAGHPLYYFAGDEDPGETDGQGSTDFGAPWWLVAPSGQKVTTSSSAASSSAASSSAASSSSSGSDAGGGW
jgi:predicted lipoprotein with Yx(FWY)xxD motif